MAGAALNLSSPSVVEPASGSAPRFFPLSETRNGTSDTSLDIDGFLDSVLMQDPVTLRSELLPPALAFGLGLCVDGCSGQQGSNGRKQGSGRGGTTTPAAPLPTSKTPAAGGTAGPQSPEMPLQDAKAAQERPAALAGRGAEACDQEASRVQGAGGQANAEFAAMSMQNRAAAAGAAAAQAAYAEQQKQQATALAAAAQAYSQQQQAAFAHQAQAQVQQALAGLSLPQQEQQAAYAQAFQAQQAAAYAAAAAVAGHYPASWPYGYNPYYAQQYQQQMFEYQQGLAQAQQQAGVQQGAGTVLTEGAGSDDEEAKPVKRPRLIWTQALHRRFLSAVDKCGGIDRALPKAVMHEMEITGLTRENVASHLQKYRLRKRKDEDDTDLLHDGIDIPELHKHAASPALENDFVPHGAAVLGGSGRAPEKTPDALPTAAGTPDDHNNSNTPVAAAAAAHRNYVSGEGEGAGAGRHAKRSKRALRSMPEAGTEAVNNAEGCRDS